ncbi:Serine/threonine-protein kinase TAO1-A [Gossypium australe]|uniref:Serine/threonine-protein kinase TAO1-A n=1 Tax=Gossypium australe TaxID=47621 RepID=A0A5B6TYV5_9ROSI|nr:Serine/threonine-protein kinase TAO1-A [Gossypium australe]
MKPTMASEELLKPFYQRATEAEERLSRLEAVLAGNKGNGRDAGNQELSQLISELQAKLEDANAETLSEREKAKKLAMENEKLKYRIAHLVQAVKVADQKLECMRGDVSEATAQTSSKFETMRL